MEKDWSDAETVKQLEAEIDSLKEELFRTEAILSEKIYDLEGALSFYANRSHYDLFIRSHSSLGDYETSFIQDDGGQIARDALKREEL